MKPQCPEQTEYRTHTSWWAQCTRPVGHPGRCEDGYSSWQAERRIVPVSVVGAAVEQNYDANGTPCL